MISKIKIAAKQYWFLYVSTLSICVGLKYLSRVSDCDVYQWILTPTVRWVSILCGISFEYLPHSGYVNHFHQFLIAPPCAGLKFMTIVFLMLIFSFLHQIRSKKAGWVWFFFSAAFTYGSTVLINGIRISAAIYLPGLLEDAGLLKGWLNPDRLHTLIGTIVYFSALCLIYPLASGLCKDKFGQWGQTSPETAHASGFRPFAPVFWYLLVVLAVPFFTRLFRNDWSGFGSYTILVIGVCTVVTGATCLIRRFQGHTMSGNTFRHGVTPGGRRDAH